MRTTVNKKRWHTGQQHPNSTQSSYFTGRIQPTRIPAILNTETSKGRILQLARPTKNAHALAFNLPLPYRLQQIGDRHWVLRVIRRLFLLSNSCPSYIGLFLRTSELSYHFSPVPAQLTSDCMLHTNGRHRFTAG